MAKKAGYKCKVTLGSYKVLAIGSWKLDGVTADQMETSEFGDNWKTFMFGMKDGGTLSFSGFMDPADITGQIFLQRANLNNTDVTNLRLYVDNTSYYAPCTTTGYYSPDYTTGNDTMPSWINIVSYNLGAEKNGMLTVDFTAKISGCMVLT